MPSYLEKLKQEKPALSRYADEDIIRLLPRYDPEQFGGLDPEQVRFKALDDRSAIGRGFDAGIDQLQAMGGGAAALAGDATGIDSVRDWGLDVYRRNMEEAALSAPETNFMDIDGVGDALNWAGYTLGNLAPMMATSVVGGGAGGILAGQGVKATAASMLAGLTSKGVAADLAKKEVGAFVAKRVALGQALGAASASTGMSAGSIYGETEDAAVSAVHGLIAGSIDALPIMRIFGRFGKSQAAKEALESSVIREIGKQGVLEGGTEAVQTFIEQHANHWVETEGKSLLGDIGETDWREIIEAAAAGTLGGAAMGGGASLVSGDPMFFRKPAAQKPEDELDSAIDNADRAATDTLSRGGDALDAEIARAGTEEIELPQAVLNARATARRLYSDPVTAPESPLTVPGQMPDFPRTQSPASNQTIPGQWNQPSATSTLTPSENTPIDSIILAARKAGDETSAARLEAAKRMQALSERFASEGNDQRAANMAERAQAIIEDVKGKLPADETEVSDIPAQSGERISVWTGRRGDGYETQEAAEAGLATRKRIRADLDWRIELMPSGKYQLAGYATERQARDRLSQPDMQAVDTLQQARNEGESRRASQPDPAVRDMRGAAIDRAMRSIEARKGVATQAEADLLAEYGMGKPYDRVMEAPQKAQQARSTKPATDVLASLDRLAEPTGVRTVRMSSGEAFPNEQYARKSLPFRSNPGARIVPSDDGGVLIEIPERADQGAEWRKFAPETGTLNVPRETMPQIKAEHRGAMVNFLKGRFIASEKESVAANTLKPTQTEFSPAKVKQALEYEGGNRSILVSSDNYVVDGHHQWLANLDGDIQVIRIDAPIQEILEVIQEFPSATTGEATPAGNYSAQLVEFAKKAKSLKEVRDYAVKQFGPRSLKALDQAITGAWNIRNQEQRKKVKENDTISVAVAKLGGIKPEWQQNITGDTTMNKMVPGVGRVFTQTGTSPDDMALKLLEEGYITQAQYDDMDGRDALYEGLNDDLSGRRKVYRVDSLKAQEEMLQALDDQYEAEEQALQSRREQMYDEIAQEHGVEAAERAKLYDDAQDNITDDLLSDIDILNQQNQERDDARETDGEPGITFDEATGNRERVRETEGEAQRESEEVEGSEAQDRRAEPAVAAKPETGRAETQIDAFGLSAQESGDIDARIADLRRELRNAQDNVIGMAGLAPGFIEDAMRSRKVPKSAKDAIQSLRQQIRDLEKSKKDIAAGRQTEAVQPAASSEAVVVSGARSLNEDGRATDGKPINPGDTFRTSSGRMTTPYPKQKSEKYASQWLIDNATQEAESRGDSFNSRAFERTSMLKGGALTTADRDLMLMYLFGEQPRVIPKMTRALFSQTSIGRQVELGKFKTGKPVTFNYAHNTESATKLFGLPKKESSFGRWYEPSGKYMVEADSRSNTPGVEYGEVTFQNPLVIENNDLGWKKSLSDYYEGKRGKALSKALIDDGYDGVVTLETGAEGRPKYVSEILDLTTFDESKARFSASDEKTLYVAHNLSAENLRHADEIGGLAAPSLAIADIEKGVFDSFGEITLLADPSITQSKGARTFNADVYSPRHPRAQIRINEKEYNKLIERLDAATSDIRYLENPGMDDLENHGARALVNNPAFMYAHLKSKGVSIKPVRDTKTAPAIRKAAAIIEKLPYSSRREWYNNTSIPELQKMAEDYYRAQDEQYVAATGKSSGIFDEDGELSVHLKQRFISDATSYANSEGIDKTATNAAISKKFRTEKMKNDLEAEAGRVFNSIVKDKVLFKGFTNSGNRRYAAYNMENIVAEMTKSLQGGESYNYGAGSVRSKYASEIKSIQEMRNRKSELVTEEEMKAIKDESQTKLFEAMDALKPYYKYDSNSFGYYDDASSAIAEGRSGLREAFKMNAEVDRIAADIISYLKNLPTQYFETKMQRAVGLNEFATAIVPRGTSEDVIQILQKNGIAIRYYKRGDGQSRLKAIKGSKALFQQVYHGTPHKFDKFSLGAIGTGEGAQAYGWGLYFASNKAIAEYYRDALAGGEAQDVFVDGKKHTTLTADREDFDGIALQLIHDYGTVDSALEQVDGYISRGASKELWDMRRPAIEKYRDKNVEFRDASGSLYQVDIPEDSELLDWDKPLSEQPEKVREAIAPAIALVVRESRIPERVVIGFEGARLYRHLVDHFNKKLDSRKSGLYSMENADQAASMLLNSLGIPGLRYLDGSSRNSTWEISSPDTTVAGDWMVKDSNQPNSTGAHFATEAEAREYLAEKQKQNHNYVIWDESRVTVEAVNDELRQAMRASRGLDPSSGRLIAAKGKPGTTVATVTRSIAKSVEALQAELDVTVVQSIDELPRNLRIQIPENTRIKGAYWNNSVYLVADNIESMRDAQVVLAHELVGHKGVLEMLDSLGLDAIEVLKTEIDRLLKMKSRTAQSIAGEADRRYGDTRDDSWYAEFMAIAAERREKDGPIASLLRTLREYILRALKAFGLNGPFSVSELDIMLSDAERYLSGRRETQGVRAGAMASQQGFDLDQYTEQDISGRQRARTDREKAEALRKQRQQADDQVDDFVLTGSNSEADQAAARGQQKLFSKSEVGTIVSGSGSNLVTLYHGTNGDGAISIDSDKMIRGPVFMTPRREVAEEYAGDNARVIELRIPKSNLMIDLDLAGSRLLSVEDANSYTENEDWTIDDYINNGYSVAVNENVSLEDRGTSGSGRGQGSLFSQEAGGSAFGYTKTDGVWVDEFGDRDTVAHVTDSVIEQIDTVDYMIKDESPNAAYEASRILPDILYARENGIRVSDLAVKRIQKAAAQYQPTPAEQRVNRMTQPQTPEQSQIIFNESEIPYLKNEIMLFERDAVKDSLTDQRYLKALKTDLAYREKQQALLRDGVPLDEIQKRLGMLPKNDPSVIKPRNSYFSAEKITDTKAFRNWFGDSKVVDENGEPLVVYHGAPDARFMEDDATFKSTKERYGMGEGGGAFWFARSRSVASSYADDRRAFDYQRAEPDIISAYLKLENPLVVEGNGRSWRDAQARGKTSDVIDEARAKGHDGVIIRNVRDNYNSIESKGRETPTDTYVVFESTQIKSVDNAGSFDPSNPSILLSRVDDNNAPNLSRRRFIIGLAGSLAAAKYAGVRQSDVSLGKAIPIAAEVARSQISDAAKQILESADGSNDSAILKKAIREIAQNGPAEFRALAENILELLPDSPITLNINNTHRSNASGSVTLTELPEMKLYVGGDQLGFSHATVLHEALHVSVLARFKTISSAASDRNFKLIDMSAPQAKAAIDQFTSLWQEFKRVVKDSRDEQVSYSEAYSNPDEFFVRALTDPTLQKYLAGIKYEGKTLFERFKDWVKSIMFGMGEKGVEASWLDAALLASDDVINAMKSDPANFEIVKRFNAFDKGERFGADSSNALFSKNDSTGFAIPDETLVSVAVRKMQDKFKVLKDLQANIIKAGGDIDENSNAYLAEELFHGKAENDIREMQEQYVEPLAKKMAQFDITRDQLDQFLYARHARERNARIAEINPEMPDGGSGMTNAQARAKLDEVRATGKQGQYEQLAGIVYDMLQLQRDMVREGGLESDPTIDAWEEGYEFYVPLKGWAEDTKQEGMPRTGKGFAISGRESKRALGRSSQAASPTSFAINDLTEKLIRRRKNEVGNAFLKLVQSNPNPEYWQVFTDEKPETQRAVKKVKDPDTGEMVEQVTETAIPMAMLTDRYFTTKKNGKTFYIKLEDPRLMKAMKNIGPESNGALIRTMAGMTRILSALNTSYSPEFMVSNFARDVQTALLNMQAEQSLPGGKAAGVKIAKKTMKDVPRAMKAIYGALRGTEAKTAEAKKWQALFEQFRSDGAKTGWFDMKDLDGQSKSLDNLVAMAQGGFKGKAMLWAREGAKLVENMNQSVENAVRLAAYANAIEAGISRKQAASLAKNMTVNFNRRGEIGTVLNAIYMFANASIQGTANFVRTMGTLKGEGGPTWNNLNNAQKIAVGMMAGAYFIGLANRSSAGEDEDDENWYDKVPDYVKERNIVIMKSLFGGAQDGSFWKIPLPYGYNVFYVLGNAIEAVAGGGKSVSQSAGDVTLAALGSFSPIGFQHSDSGANMVLKNAAPTIIKPIVEVALNENFMGSSIYTENLPFGTPRPDSALGRNSTPEAYRALSLWLNKVTGGSEYQSGAVDINPDVMQHFLDFFGGSAYAFFGSKVPDAVHRAAAGVVAEENRVPFLSRISGKVLPYADTEKFYQRRDVINQVYDEYRAIPAAERSSFEQAQLLKMRPLLKSTERRLSALRKVRDRIYSADLSLRERDPQLKEVEADMKAAIDRFNKAYNAIDR